MENILEKLIEAGFQPITRECSGVYDSFIKVKYGHDPHDIGWVYMKGDKLLLANIKNDEFKDIDSFITRLKEIKK